MSKRAMILGAAASIALASNEGNMVAVGARQQGKTEPVEPNGIPDRLSIQQSSPFFTSVGSYVGVRLDGEDVNNRVIEFCVSGGWVRIGTPDASGRMPRSEVEGAARKYGKVETYWRMQPSRQIRRQLARML
jgi:hypothetical protein